jgi:hypothetical protein
MPIQEKDLGKYNRPGIYIEETDNSIIEAPVQNVLINLVPGFSKKGPFNNPVYIENKTDFERVFGNIDYQLERKGSYFHRTCLKMIETGPIWALNLLDTVPNRDQLNWVSVSCSAKNSSSDFDNPKKSDYERFFNRQDLWERDSQSFLDLVNDPVEDGERLLHLTNMGDRAITVFLFKSTADNFNVTAEQWYNGANNVPQFISPKSLISDYLVNVLILAGKWTDYKSLSVDTTWSNYFSPDGLLISQIQNFVNEDGVDVLASYDASLIPNFKDLNGRDLYIETLINNDTNKTNLFCTYNEDLLLDSDYPTDLMDLIGDTIVGENVDSINFLSYDQNIKEDKTYENKPLDYSNNVFAPDIGGYGTTYGSTWLNWSTYDIEYSSTDTSPLNVTFNTSSTSYYIINGVKLSGFTGTTLVELEATTVDDKQRTDILYLDSDGFQVQKGTETASGLTETFSNINFSNNNTIILGTVLVENNGGSYTVTYSPITVDSSGFIALDVTMTATSDTMGDYLSVEFNGTSGSIFISNKEYEKLRSIKYFTELSINLESNKGVIVLNSDESKQEIIDPVSIPYTVLTNAIVKIYIDNPTNYTTGAIYYIDHEFSYDSGTQLTTTYTSNSNVVAKYSDFYIDFYNGEINNGDYIGGDEDNTLTMYFDSNGVLTVDFTTPPTAPIIVTSDIGNWKQTLEIEGTLTDQTNTVEISVDRTRYTEVKKGDYIEAYVDTSNLEIGEQPRKLTRIIGIKNDSNGITKTLKTDAPIKIYEFGTSEQYTTTYPAIWEYATHLKGVNLSPFKIHTDSIPNGTEQRQSDILDVMGIGTQMFKGLTNKNKISWRYLVDSFGLGLSNQSKQQYVDLCGEKLNCLGFINMPSAKYFKKSDNSSFTNDDGSLSTEFIADGADQNKNPDFLYTFGSGSGRSTVGYFFPFVRSTHNGITKEVPPAAYVASAYMRKQLSNVAGTYPWTIVAGINMGRVTDIGGTEMDFTNDDLANLAGMGANPITFVRNVGYTINDESTAQVFPVSSLSYMHSREVLIELENELYDMLLRYQWKFNTPAIRSEIKYRADRICQRYVDSNALYAYRNVCDTTNNTNYIIDLQGGVLDTFVEIVKGMGWIVNNITIERTGTINSTGFQQ